MMKMTRVSVGFDGEVVGLDLSLMAKGEGGKRHNENYLSNKRRNTLFCKKMCDIFIGVFLFFF